MKYIKLGQTDISISRIAMGSWVFSGGLNWGTQEEAGSIHTVHAAMEAGINFFDTAEAYKSDDYSEAILGKALAGTGIDNEFHKAFDRDPVGTLESHGVFIPSTMSIEFQRKTSDRPRIVVYEQNPNSKFKARVLYLQLVMMAGR